MATEPDPPRKRSRQGRVVVARVSDIPENSRLIVTVRGREIGIFNVAGKLYAIGNRCPHRGGDLCKGDIIGRVYAERPGEVALDPTMKFITCPWHGWEFDIETGQSWYDPASPPPATPSPDARHFGVEVANGADLEAQLAEGQVGVVDERAQAAYVDPTTHRVRGPFQADVFPVDRDDEYVVLTLRSARATQR